MLVLVPVAAIITLVVAIGLLTRDADDHRGHRRWWVAVCLVSTIVLVGWVAFFLYIYSHASTT